MLYTSYVSTWRTSLIKIIKDTIIGAYSKIQEIVLNNSLIGSDASVKGVSRNLNIGDNTEIELGGSSK